jgi:hypothetical protein
LVDRGSGHVAQISGVSHQDQIMSSATHSVGCRAAAHAAVIAAAVFLAGCSQELPPRSTTALMDNPTVLQGVLFRCNQLQGEALRDPECRNARAAVDRLAAEDGTASGEAQEKAEADAAAQFERARAARRAREERERRSQEAQQPAEPDPYNLPLIPEQPNAPLQADAPPQAEAPLQTIVVSAASLPAER